MKAVNYKQWLSGRGNTLSRHTKHTIGVVRPKRKLTTDSYVCVIAFSVSIFGSPEADDTNDTQSSHNPKEAQPGQLRWIPGTAKYEPFLSWAPRRAVWADGFFSDVAFEFFLDAGDGVSCKSEPNIPEIQPVQSERTPSARFGCISLFLCNRIFPLLFHHQGCYFLFTHLILVCYRIYK